MEFNHYCAQLTNEYGGSLYELPVEKRKEILKAVNWSENDYIMLMNWAYSNENVYSLEKIKYVVEHKPKTVFNLSQGIKKFKQSIDNLPLGPLYLLIIVFNMTMHLICFRLKHWLVILLTYAISLLTCLYLSIWVKPIPMRVLLPTYFVLIFIPILLNANILKHKNKIPINIATNILVFFSVSLLLLGFNFLYQLSIYNKRFNKQFKELIQIINPKKENLYFTWGSSFPYEWIPLFDNLSYLKDFNFVGFAWTGQSTHSVKNLKSFKLENLDIDLLGKKNVYLIACDDLISLYKTFLKEHYDKEISITSQINFNRYSRECKEPSCSSSIYQLKEKLK